MGWCLGTSGPESLELTERFFAALGRALYVATEFEQKCVYVLRIGRLAARVEADQNSSLTFEDVFAPANDDQTMLGPTLRALARLGKVKREDMQLLDAGRRARNYIAHEGGSLGVIDRLRTDRVLDAMQNLRSCVEVLSRADALISEWIYCIDEKEAAPVWLTDAYPGRLLQWVFDGAPDRLRQDRAVYQSQLLRSQASTKSSPTRKDE